MIWLFLHYSLLKKKKHNCLNKSNTNEVNKEKKLNVVSQI